MEIKDIVTELVKIIAKGYAKNDQREFSVLSLVNQIGGADLTQVMSALHLMQDKGLVELQGTGPDTTVKPDNKVLLASGPEELLEKGLNVVKGWFTDND